MAEYQREQSAWHILNDYFFGFGDAIDHSIVA